MLQINSDEDTYSLMHSNILIESVKVFVRLLVYAVRCVARKKQGIMLKS
jgi:hypothetical protein